MSKIKSFANRKINIFTSTTDSFPSSKSSWSKTEYGFSILLFSSQTRKKKTRQKKKKKNRNWKSGFIQKKKFSSFPAVNLVFLLFMRVQIIAVYHDRLEKCNTLTDYCKTIGHNICKLDGWIDNLLSNVSTIVQN